MDVKTYRAKTMQEALMLVRNDLGPQASVLHTREIRSGLLGWLGGSRQIEVTASSTVQVPSRMPTRRVEEPELAAETTAAYAPPQSEVTHETRPPTPPSSTPRRRESNGMRRGVGEKDVQEQLQHLQSMVQGLVSQREPRNSSDLPDTLFQLFTELIDAEVNEELARELIDNVRNSVPDSEPLDTLTLKNKIAESIENEIQVSGPIHVTPNEARVVALIGPTGVGKTTTIAKLAANYHLREKIQVGLITVDTYRIAAVEQLRTYADIIDLPMEVVATPREMRQAVAKLADKDLILMDTAGRSPRDDVRIQELKLMLGEAAADEVHLVLSSVASPSSLIRSAERFADVGASSVLLTKLDEATALGNLLPLLRSCGLPVSYLTNGQNVPDDIASAEPARLSRTILGMEQQW